MGRLLTLFLLSLLLLTSVGSASIKEVQPAPPRRKVSKPISYRLIYAAGVPCHVIFVDMRSRNLRLQAVRAQDLGARFQTFADFVRQTRPLAAINGTFFDVRSGAIICNLVRNGRLLESGGAGHTFALGRDRKIRWMSTAGRAGGRINWKNTELAISAGPTLVRQHRIVLCPEAEGFSDPGLFRQARRSGLATTKSGRLLLVSVNRPITLGQFARSMKALGVNEAINLDGGTSTGLYAQGSYLSKPGRKLTNVLVVRQR
ncbi:MAG: phosphodiester glycosidase family protein [Candidatus Eremiobacteraeota bacterium]|nr:phosphodiester glycosidase family protein [Candidatus Eremiobacteraeota bacterium]MCW5867673.1 phosphodiester glycosidase family protein [Candidatus Eremiobacteraeota bacterium]